MYWDKVYERIMVGTIFVFTKQKNKVGRLMLPGFQSYCEATIIKTVWCW